MRRLLIVPTLMAVLIALALAAAWQAPRFLDWDRYRATVERVASAGLGRPVRIAGPIRLSLLPQATLRAGDVTVADTGDGAGASVGELRMRVGLRALLTGRVEPQDLVLHDATMRLRWPLAGLTLGGAPPPNGLHARVENGTLLLGGLAITAVSGELSAGGPDNALSASGLATVLGRPWRMTGRLGRAGSDGSATVAVSLDGQGAGVGTGMALAGQVAADGSVSGRITGRGPDLSLLLPAPPQPWNADGRLVAGSGLLVADDLEVTIGGSPARGAVALRLLPQLRLDAALATNRLDLDAWLPPLLHGGPVALPTGIDLSAEAAPLAGGVLRRLRAGFELSGGAVTLRESDVVLPGDAPLHLSGVLAGSRFTGDARLAAPDLPQVLAWLRPRLPALLQTAALATLHTASLAARVQAEGDAVSFTDLRGDVDGVALTGELAVQGAPHASVAARLQLTGPVLDRWLPALPQDLVGHASATLDALAAWVAGLDADVSVTALHPVWQGTVLDRLDVEGGAHGGVLVVRRAVLDAPGLSARVSGSIDTASRITDGMVAVRLARAETLADAVPAGWQFARPLLRGAAELDASITGPPGAWATVARVDLADARLQANGRWDLPGRHWAGSVSLHHPGAPRLLSQLGLAGMVGWLGDGSLSLQGTVDAAAGRVALGPFEVSAGGLRGGGDVALAWPDAVAGLTGALEIDTLPVPLPYVRSVNPLGFDVLRAGNATLAVRAAHLAWGAGMDGGAASAKVNLAGGVLRLEDIAAQLAGGTLDGQLVVDATGTPRLRATMTLGGGVLDGAVFGTGLDLIAGVADGALDVTATGYSPAALVASLSGTVRASITEGALSGLDGGQLLSVLRRVPAGAATVPADMAADVAGALRHGAMPFTRMTVAGRLGNGLLTVSEGTVTAPSAAISAAGSVDMPGGSVDLTLTVQPAMAGAPALGARLIGPAADPVRTVDLVALTRWLADH